MSGLNILPKTYVVKPHAKAPLHKFICDALEAQGANILFTSPIKEAPFRITFELPSGERSGIVAYAFLANHKKTKNRPDNEHRFQIKYGQNDGAYHELWQDPHCIYTTLFCGIDPERGIFVGADPYLHNPTRFFISLEYKSQHVADILKLGWHAWERDRKTTDAPVEILVGGTQNNFLKYIQFERAAAGESQGHRHLLAEQHPGAHEINGFGLRLEPEVPKARLHTLTREFNLTEFEVLDLISNARRLKMAVRGWVAEEHLTRLLRKVPGVSDCNRCDDEGAGDVSLNFMQTPISVECKNVLRRPDAMGRARVDFQRTRASKSDPCSRFYSHTDFDVLAACLNAIESKWCYRFLPTHKMEAHSRCPHKLSNIVKVDDSWFKNAHEALAIAAKIKN